jgi:hypothetical protein
MKVGWYYHRLRAMTVSELAHRVTERWKHRSDASFAESLLGIQLGEAVEGVIDLPDPAAAPESVKQVLAQDAVSLMRSDWKLFGWREVNVGTPPQWHRDSACGIELPSELLASRLNHRDLPDGADARTVWEINRWSEMVRLAMSGWVNGDMAAVQTALAWMNDWGDKNPVGYGINWTSPLEAGLRLVNCVWVDALVDSSLCALQRIGNEDATPVDALKRAQRTLAERIVPAHAAWVWRYRSFGSSANNHLLGELVGLLHAVKRWRALEKVVCPAEELWDEISQCVLDQFAEDGGNKEQALHYHLFAWEMAWHAVKLMGVTEGPVVDRLSRAAEFFVHAAHDSEQWEYGDNDDAQIVPLTMEREHAVAEWRAWMRGEPKGESVRYWLGDPPVGNFARQERWVMPHSGMAVREVDGWRVRMDASPLGFGAMAAHGHCDALHVSIWDGPHALVIDPGTGGYYGMKEQRVALAAWNSHNSPQPERGFSSPRRLGLFLWAQHPVRPFFREDDVHMPHVIMTRADHTSLGHSCLAERQVRYDEARRGWEIEDSLSIGSSKDGDHSAEGSKTRWHLAPELSVEQVEPTAFRMTRDGGTWLLSFHGDGIKACVQQGMASRRYGEFQSCTVIEVTGKSQVKTTLVREHN